MAKNIYIDPLDLETVVDHGTTIEVTGTELHTNARVTFAGDRRMMVALLDAVVMRPNEDHFALIEEWAILQRTEATS